MGSHEVVGKGYVNTKSSQTVFIGAIFTFIYNTKHKSMAKLISQSYSPLSSRLGEMEPFEDDLSTRGHLTTLRNRPQQKQPRQLSPSILAELLVNVYSYRLMVKVCIAVMCMEGSFSQIRSHIP